MFYRLDGHMSLKEGRDLGHRFYNHMNGSFLYFLIHTAWWWLLYAAETRSWFVFAVIKVVHRRITSLLQRFINLTRTPTSSNWGQFWSMKGSHFRHARYWGTTRNWHRVFMVHVVSTALLVCESHTLISGERGVVRCAWTRRNPADPNVPQTNKKLAHSHGGQAPHKKQEIHRFPINLHMHLFEVQIYCFTWKTQA